MIASARTSGEVAELRGAARAKAHATEVAILADAKSVADARVGGAVADIETARAQASGILRGTANELSADIVSSVLGRPLAARPAPGAQA